MVTFDGAIPSGWKKKGWSAGQHSAENNNTAEALADDGVRVKSYSARPDKVWSDFIAEAKSSDKAIAVLKWLRENGWTAEYSRAKRGEMTPDAVLVQVGLKPYPFFEDANFKDAVDAENKALHIDVNRYKNKTILVERLTLGGVTRLSSLPRKPEEPKKPD